MLAVLPVISGVLTVNRRLLPRIDFKAYRKPQFLYAVYDEWGQGGMVYRMRYKRESCPICQRPDRRGRSFSWSFERCSFYCFSCRAKGDALELVRVLKGCSVVEAAKWLEERGGTSGSGLLLCGTAS